MKKLISFWMFCLLMTLNLSAWANEQANVFWQALKEGGKVVLIRHAEIDRSIGSSFVLDPTCFEEKNLNSEGKAQATALGELFRQHQVKIEQVFASPHCRTQQTASLAFNDFQVKPYLRLIKAISTDSAEANLKQTRQVIGDYRGKGNLVLVTHRPNIGELIYQTLEPAEMAVLEPLGEGSFDLIARFKLD